MVYRSGRSYGNIPGEDSRFDQCDFEWDPEVAEPRDLSKGNVARSILYMNRQYKLPVSPEMMAIMKAWNKQDPPSEQERIRNDSIEQLQGQRNPYIDNPGLADRPGVVRGR
jgi:deoxyribonuclease-1